MPDIDIKVKADSALAAKKAARKEVAKKGCDITGTGAVVEHTKGEWEVKVYVVEEPKTLKSVFKPKSYKSEKEAAPKEEG